MMPASGPKVVDCYAAVFVSCACLSAVVADGVAFAVPAVHVLMLLACTVDFVEFVVESLEFSGHGAESVFEPFQSFAAVAFLLLLYGDPGSVLEPYPIDGTRFSH